MEDPKVFDLKELDTDQWCEAMKAAGMKMVIITVKHHDGFVLWQQIQEILQSMVHYQFSWIQAEPPLTGRTPSSKRFGE